MSRATSAGCQQRDQALARTFKGGFDKMKADLQKLKPEVLQNYIENYFPAHLGAAFPSAQDYRPGAEWQETVCRIRVVPEAADYSHHAGWDQHGTDAKELESR